MERLVGKRASVGLEIENYLTYFKADYYFGGANELLTDKHKEIFIKSCKYVINMYVIFLGKKIFLKNEWLELKLNDNIKYDKKNNVYVLNKKYFLENLDFLLESLYFSKNCRSILYSKNINFDIYCDPLDIKVVFNSDNEEKNKIETDNYKSVFLNRVFEFLKTFRK